jgi:hypothetical protein
MWSHANTTRTHRKQDPKNELINMKKLEEEQIQEQVRVSIESKLEAMFDSRLTMNEAWNQCVKQTVAW